jgi:hypothetical protein
LESLLFKIEEHHRSSTGQCSRRNPKIGFCATNKTG